MPKQPSTSKGKIINAEEVRGKEISIEQAWKEGRWGYLYVAPDYEPGTHDAEKGEVTWHTVSVRPGKDRKEE
jgi:hypothetical protein